MNVARVRKLKIGKGSSNSSIVILDLREIDNSNSASFCLTITRFHFHNEFYCVMVVPVCILHRMAAGRKEAMVMVCFQSQKQSIGQHMAEFLCHNETIKKNNVKA